MLERLNKGRLRVIMLGLLIMAFGFGEAFASDWSDLIKKAEVKYKNFYEEVKDITMIQELKVVSPEGEVTPETKMMKKGEKFRIETKMPVPNMPKGMEGMETVVIFDGKDTWVISPFTGKQKLPEEQRMKYQGNLDWWHSISEEAEIVGSEKISGRDCYLVKFKEKEESPITRLWIDKNKLFVVKGEGSGEKGETMTMAFSDFRTIKGDWEIPYKTEIFSDGKVVTTVIMKSLEINKGLSDDLFDPDKVEVKGMDMQDMMKKMMQKEGQ